MYFFKGGGFISWPFGFLIFVRYIYKQIYINIYIEIAKILFLFEYGQSLNQRTRNLDIVYAPTLWTWHLFKKEYVNMASQASSFCLGRIKTESRYALIGTR